ncbi:hypothetical protein POM88_033964 [Heracleum sosnowskyi]|uniref:F-box domain-containing protein n=1 Tax=Heracleum sosnowskyi TaxID=360622 RepID=A0AAD8HKI9_9APIA|nr:hypothetical protein POM88_033964 [Heracleum sosnowskyi]
MCNLFQILVKIFHFFLKQVLGYGRNPKKNVDKNVFWSELDENLLGEIMSRLSLTDQARFHAVCKIWHSVRPIATYKSLPWFVSIHNVISTLSNPIECRLYEPYSSPKALISTYKISLSELGIPFYWKGFTLKLIKLPQLDYPFLSRDLFTRTFSTDLNSPDCIFLILNSCTEPEFIVMTCRQSHKEWTIRKFDNFVLGFCRAEYMNHPSLYGTVILKFSLHSSELKLTL